MRGWRAGGKQENRPQNYLSFSTLTLLPFSPIYHQFTCAAPMAARLAISLAAEVGMDWDETGVGWKRRRERRAEEERRRRTGEEENRRRMVLAKGVGMTRCEIMRQEE